MSNKSAAKGTRAEHGAIKILHEYTGLNFKRVPMSGSGVIKGDIFIPNSRNNFSIEVKHYKDDKLTTRLLTSVKPTIYEWWEQALRQSGLMGISPLLIFKHDRSKYFVCTDVEPASIDYEYIYLSEYAIYIAKLEDWLKWEDIEWV